MNKNSQLISLHLNKNLLDKIDDYKNNQGFTTRTNTIIHLLLLSLKEKEHIKV